MAAVQASGSPYSQPDWLCITLNEDVSVPKPGSGQVLVRVFGSSVNPVKWNPFAKVRVFREERASSSRWANDLMYGSEVWSIVQGAYAQYAGWHDPHCWRDQPAVSAGSGRSLDLETHGRRDGWAGWHGFHWSPTGQSSRRGDGIVFVKGLGAVSQWATMCRTASIPWAMTPWTSSSTTWVSQACGNCRGRSGSPSGIMQIVTSAVRVDVALTL